MLLPFFFIITLPYSLQHPTCEHSPIFNQLNMYVGGRAYRLPISFPLFIMMNLNANDIYRLQITAPPSQRFRPRCSMNVTHAPHLDASH